MSPMSTPKFKEDDLVRIVARERLQIICYGPVVSVLGGGLYRVYDPIHQRYELAHESELEFPPKAKRTGQFRMGSIVRVSFISGNTPISLKARVVGYDDDKYLVEYTDGGRKESVHESELEPA